MELLPRAIPLERASNLRDLGGWPTVGGQRVRTGCVYRSAALLDLSPADEARIATLELRTIVDLRGVRERAHAPVTIANTRSVHLPIEPTVGAGLKDILRTGQLTGHVTAADMMQLLGDAYRAYATQSAHTYRALFALIADGELPLLFHCSAGKDRTGFGAALLLTALGVAWKDVLADYLATNHLWRREVARHFDLPADVAEALLGAHTPLLDGALAAVGSVEAYLPRLVVPLRERLVN